MLRTGFEAVCTPYPLDSRLRGNDAAADGLRTARQDPLDSRLRGNDAG